MNQHMKKRIDGRKNANVQKGNVIPMGWMWSDYVERFLVKEIIRAERRSLVRGCLHVCCASSMLGDVRADISEDSTRTMHADLFHLFEYYKPNQFPFVVIDPPFDAYNPNSRLVKEQANGDPYQWQYDAYDIASKALILRRNLIMTNWKCSNLEYFLIRDSRPSSTILEIIWK